MKTIKTRKTVKGIKTLDKSVTLSTRMKNAFVRTKERAEETQNTHHNSPADYASSNIQRTAQSSIRGTKQNFSNARGKVRENIERTKIHFREVKHQMPKERTRTAEQANQTAQKAEKSAEKLQEIAKQAVDSAQEAKKTVLSAKQTMHEVRQTGRQALRNVKQNSGIIQNTQPKNITACSQQKGKILHLRSTSKSNGNLSNGQTKTYKVKSGRVPHSNFRTSKYMLTHNEKPIGSQKNIGQGQNKPKSLSLTNSKAVNTTPVNSNPLNDPVSNSTARDTFLPNYLRRKTNTPKSASNMATSLEKSKKSIKSTAKDFKKNTKGAIKTAKKSVKTARKTAKTAQKTAQVAVKSSKAAEKTARVAAKTATQAAKSATKAVIATVKMAIATIKGLIALIAAGGGIAIAVVLIICLIGLLVSSVFGVFFSGEPEPNTGKTVNTVIADIDAEYTDKIDDIIDSNIHDRLDMSGARTAWKEVLAVYTVKTVTDPDNPMEVATMNNEKADILQTVFWDMNTISNTTDTMTVYEDVLGENGLPTGETAPVSKVVQHITVAHKTTDEMAIQYGFNNEQKEWLEELLKPEYHNLWNGLLYGITTIGDGSLVEIANTQIGNIGGEPYWRWYGFNSRVAWCACFVSWCAEQSGYIDAGIIPRFSLCDDGIQWFKNRSQWQNNGYAPAPGDIIFFDWNNDGISDHVGIVERTEGDYVHTIEGNTSDSCARRSYRLGNEKIMGYGVPLYQ